jgi:hypothetical protein
MRALSGWGLGVLAAALIACGCGQGSSASTSSAIQLESPAVGVNGVISPRVSCGLGTIWLPLKWGSLPSGTKELVLYFGWFKEGAEAGGKRVVVPFGSVIREIEPSIHGIAANTLPEGSEYSYFTINNCQPARKGQSYLVELFALDHPQLAVPEALDVGFVTGITEEALGVGQFAGDSETETQLTEESLATGHFIATYGPKPK